MFLSSNVFPVSTNSVSRLWFPSCKQIRKFSEQTCRRLRCVSYSRVFYSSRQFHIPLKYPSSDYWNDSWSDDYLLERCRSAPQLQDAVFMVPGIDIPFSSIFVLCKDTVVKRLLNFCPLLPEVNALEFVRSRTSIPVPKVRRYITDKNAVEGYLMMEKIEGTSLNRLWDDLPGDTRRRIVSSLRDYICQLREASGAYNCPFPGPIAENKPRTCVGPWMLLETFPLVRFQPARTSCNSSIKTVISHSTFRNRWC